MAGSTLTRKHALLIFLSVLGGALASHSANALLLLNMPLTLNTAVVDGVLRISGNLILASVIIYTVSGTTKPTGFQSSTKRKATAVLLVVFAVVLAILSFTLAGIYSSLNTTFSESNTLFKDRVLEKLQRNDDAAQKSKLTHLYAQLTYEETGESIEYLTSDGRSVQYQPDPEIVKSREVHAFFIAYKKMSTSAGIIWLVTACAGAGITLRRIYSAKRQAVPDRH